MDVKDYTQKLDSARNRYRDAQTELKESYDKTIEDTKNNFDQKVKKQQQSYEGQRLKLQEQNAIEADRYSDITKKTISDNQEKFINDVKNIKANSAEERMRDRQVASEKLSNLSSSYDRSTKENQRLHDQAKKSMEERYNKNLKKMDGDFNQQVASLDSRSNAQNDKIRLDARKDREKLESGHQKELINLRSAEAEDRNRVLNRLKEDNEVQRAGFDSDLKNIQTQQNSRIKEMAQAKIDESERSQEQFSDLQESIKKKNAAEQAKMQKEHGLESKALEKKFNDDIRNIQSLSDQKVKGVDLMANAKKDKERVVEGFENRLLKMKDEMEQLNNQNVLKETKIDEGYREELKNQARAHIEQNEKKELESNKAYNQNLARIKERTDSSLEQLKKENQTITESKDGQIHNLENSTKRSLDSQRVEFGKVVNSLNEKSMQTLSDIKDDFAKDKKDYIEKSKKEFNAELVALKEDYQRQMQLKDQVNDKKMENLEKQMLKIIDGYENKMAQIERKASVEIESLKMNDQERKIRENQARNEEMAMIQKEHENEIKSLRDKFERMIYRDRSDNEKIVNKIVQRYEDQLGRERLESQKNLNLKLAESQANMERLYKASELEKSTMRQQYQDRMEQLKNS